MHYSEKNRDKQDTQMCEDLLMFPGYDPEPLLRAVMEKLNCASDAALCRKLQIAPPVISKIRHRRLPLGARLMIRIHEMTDMSFKEMRELSGLVGARL